MNVKRFISITVICLIPVFIWSTGFDCYNDVVEADFLCVGKKFENVDVENFVAEKNGFHLALILNSFSQPLEFTYNAAFEITPPPTRDPSTPLESLRC